MARFSALQRAENSSISPVQQFSSTPESVSVLFSEPKIPQFVADGVTYPASLRFSALQRAENSSIGRSCVSATGVQIGFSALQRAENSSICKPRLNRLHAGHVSVLFSEPKIPQSVGKRDRSACAGVSVLFSEPKIPQ